MTDRQKVFGPSTEKHLWCMHCEMTYPAGTFRVDPRSGLQMCPHDGCDGDTVVDAWDWNKVRHGREDRYPEVPVRLRVYPLYEND